MTCIPSTGRCKLRGMAPGMKLEAPRPTAGLNEIIKLVRCVVTLCVNVAAMAAAVDCVKNSDVESGVVPTVAGASVPIVNPEPTETTEATLGLTVAPQIRQPLSAGVNNPEVIAFAPVPTEP